MPLKGLITALVCAFVAGCQKPNVVEIPIAEEQIDAKLVAEELNDYLSPLSLPPVNAVKQKSDGLLRIQLRPINDDSGQSKLDLQRALEKYFEAPLFDKVLTIQFPDGLKNAKPDLTERVGEKGRIETTLTGHVEPTLMVSSRGHSAVECLMSLRLSEKLPSFKRATANLSDAQRIQRRLRALAGGRSAQDQVSYTVTRANGDGLPFGREDIDIATGSDPGGYSSHRSELRISLGTLSNVQYGESMASRISGGDPSYETVPANFDRCQAKAYDFPPEQMSFLLRLKRSFTPTGAPHYVD